MPQERLKRKILAILSADVVGYSKLMEADEENTVRTIQSYRETFFRLIEQYNGHVIDSPGDNILSEFASVVDSVQCAVEIQDVIKAKNSGLPEDRKMAFRIGINLGDVIEEDGRLYGDGINIASRIEGLAEAGGICISGSAYEQIATKLALGYIDLGKITVKNINRPIHVYRVPVDSAAGGDSIAGRKIIGRPGVVITALVSLVICIAAIALFLFSSKNATSTIIVEDEEGRQIERTIPKNEYRKKAAIFFFENKSDDKELDWLQYAIPEMLIYDLSQDIFLELSNEYVYRNASRWAQKIKEAGFEKKIGLPLVLKRKLADAYHLDHFTSGSFTKQDNEYTIKLSLYNTETARLIKENSFTGKDIFEIVDQMSFQMRNDLGVPESYLNEMRDIPVKELLTDSLPALKEIILGMNEILSDKNYINASIHFEKAVEIDPSFAYANHLLEQSYAILNQNQKRVSVIQTLMKQLYKFPERKQFFIKIVYYTIVKQDLPKQLAVAKMWVNLYPGDIEGHSYLAMFYLTRNDIDNAIIEAKEILKLDPYQYNYYIQIGDLYKQNGDFKAALEYYTRYTEAVPEDESAYTSIGDLYYTMAEYDKAETYYDKALVLEPEKIYLLLQMANIDAMNGNFDTAIQQYDAALNACKTPQEKALAYGFYEARYKNNGRISKAIEYRALKLSEMKKYVPPLMTLLEEMLTLDMYADIGKEDIAINRIKDIQNELTLPFTQKLAAGGCLLVYVTLEDAEKIGEYIDEVEELIDQTKYETLRPSTYLAWGKLYEIKGDYEAALESYNKLLKMAPTEIMFNRDIGRCYRNLTEYKRSLEHLGKALKKNPFDQKTNYEIALLYKDMGEMDKAFQHLEKAIALWKDADTEYKPAQKAKQTMAEWKGKQNI